MTPERPLPTRERFDALLQLGRQQGYVTQSQVNAELPNNPDQTLVDSLLDLLQEESLEIIVDPVADKRGWLTCTDPKPMLDYVCAHASPRKLRLMAVARCRRFWQFFQDARSRRAIEVAERLADEAVADEERQHAQADAEAARTELREKDTLSTSKEFMYLSAPERAAIHILGEDMTVVAGCGTDITWCLDFLGYPAATVLLNTHDYDEIRLLREVFGNPFSPVPLHPAWLTPTVTSLAEAIYKERAFDRIPVLGDALEDAGCANADILQHCRSSLEHSRGCWLVDSILLKH